MAEKGFYSWQAAHNLRIIKVSCSCHIMHIYNGEWFYINTSWGRILFRNVHSHTDGAGVFPSRSEWCSQKGPPDCHPSRFLMSNKVAKREHFITFSGDFEEKKRQGILTTHFNKDIFIPKGFQKELWQWLAKFKWNFSICIN